MKESACKNEEISSMRSSGESGGGEGRVAVYSPQTRREEGEGQWRGTGWADIILSPSGRKELAERTSLQSTWFMRNRSKISSSAAIPVARGGPVDTFGRGVCPRVW